MAIRARARRWGRAARIAATLLALAAATSGRAGAETMSGALARAYADSPDLAGGRAATRAADEEVPKAKATGRPQASASGSVGYLRQSLQLGTRTLSTTAPTGGALTVSQSLFDGGRTTNGVRQATSKVFETREQGRGVEQGVLLAAATAYMNALRDAATLRLDADNVAVLEQQLRDTRSRFDAGEVTLTDVAQAMTALGNGRASWYGADGSLRTSLAAYERAVGSRPGRLEAARPLRGVFPADVEEGVAVGLAESPTLAAARHAADAADLAVRVVEGALLPTAALVGSVQNETSYSGLPSGRLFQAQGVVQLSVPILDGGATYAGVRQAKELAAQARLAVDAQARGVRADVVGAYAQMAAARSVALVARGTVRSAEAALSGVREEAKVGQRTTLDILLAQQTLLQTRTSLVGAQRDEVVASYQVAVAVGRLDAATLGLDVVGVDPSVHFDQTKDRWVGLRTPEGR